jgi:hypothetical protein
MAKQQSIQLMRRRRRRELLPEFCVLPDVNDRGEHDRALCGSQVRHDLATRDCEIEKGREFSGNNSPKKQTDAIRCR